MVSVDLVILIFIILLAMMDVNKSTLNDRILCGLAAILQVPFPRFAVI